MRKITVIILFCLLSIGTAFAQAVDCPAIVKAALSAVDASCADTGRNQVCYGNIILTATPRAGVSNLAFEKAGDHASVTDIQKLQLSSMSVTDTSWGVALMELQANLPDTLPGQNVKFLLFGDVQIDNGVTDTTEVNLTTTRNVNVRLRPTTGGNVMSSLKSGQEVTATGRLVDNSWVRIKVEGDVREAGWVSAGFLKGDISKLNVIKPDAPAWGPMQSFYFKTGIGDRPCAQAPDSGILIQTPKGSGKVTLNINDVEIKLGSTVYLQAQSNNFMTVTVVEGQATLAAGGQTQIVPAGTYSVVHLDETGKATGSPSFPKPYDEVPLQTLPLYVTVFDQVKIAPTLTTKQIKTTLDNANAAPSTANNADASQSIGLPRSGSWYQVNVITDSVCPASPVLPGNEVGKIHRWYSTLTFSQNRDNLSFNDGWQPQNYSLSRVSENAYRGVSFNEYGDPTTITITFTTATTFHFSWEANFYNGTCRFSYDGNGKFTG